MTDADRPFRIIQTEELSPDAVHWLAERAEIIRCPSTDPAFGAHLSVADALVIRTYTTIDESLLQQAPRLKVIGRAGVGVDNVDLHACHNHGVTVVHTPDANTQAVIEYVFECMLLVLHPIGPVDGAWTLKHWKAQRNAFAVSRQLDEVTLGIYGFGRIGQRIAQVASAFGMKVIYHDLVEIEEDARSGATPVDRETLLRSSDVLTMHVDGRPSNRHLIDADALSLVRSNVLLINAARGFIIDAHALATFLTRNPSARAFLDVHDPEPIPADHPLLAMSPDRAYLTPHIAGRSLSGMNRMSDVVKDVWAVLNDESPRAIARPPATT